MCEIITSGLDLEPILTKHTSVDMVFLYFINNKCFLQCIWPHQLQIRLGAGQSGLQTVFPSSMHRVRLRVLAAHRPEGNEHEQIQTQY